MGHKILLALFGSSLLGGTSYAYHASRAGYGLEGVLEEPVSIRQDSVQGTRSGYTYFGRSYRGGSYRGGK